MFFLHYTIAVTSKKGVIGFDGLRKQRQGVPLSTRMRHFFRPGFSVLVVQVGEPQGSPVHSLRCFPVRQPRLGLPPRLTARCSRYQPKHWRPVWL